MKQSEYPPAELRYGENLVAIEYFNFHKDDADAGNPYNTTFGMKVISGAFQGYASCEYDIKDFRIFLDQLCELYAFQRDRVVLSEICYGSNVTLSMDISLGFSPSNVFVIMQLEQVLYEHSICVATQKLIEAKSESQPI